MSRKSSDDTAATIVGCLLFIIILPLVIAFSGWLFMVLWNAALVGLFPLIPVIDFWRSVFLVLFLGFVSNFFKSSK